LPCSPNIDQYTVVEKSRDHKSKGVGSIQLPALYVVKEDGDPSLKLWAQTLLVEDRADQGESIVQWISKLREKVCPNPVDVPLILSTWPD
jgi:protein transport protein SEC24